MTDILAGLDPEQLRAATATRPVAIIAGAGTGKTRTITHRIAHLVEGGYVNPPCTCSNVYQPCCR